MFRPLLFGLVIALFSGFSAGANALDHPASFTPEGGNPIPLAGQATRVHVLGRVEFYSLAVYVDGPLRDPSRLAEDSLAKALRIEVRYRDDIYRRVSIDWKPELLPRLEPAAIQHLRSTFAPLNHGDLVLIEYVPGKGTTIRVNKAVVVSGANHDVMLAFLDHWLGQRPVSDDMKRTLIGSS